MFKFHLIFFTFGFRRSRIRASKSCSRKFSIKAKSFKSISKKSQKLSALMKYPRNSLTLPILTNKTKNSLRFQHAQNGAIKSLPTPKTNFFSSSIITTTTIQEFLSPRKGFFMKWKTISEKISRTLRNGSFVTVEISDRSKNTQ